MGAIFHLFMTFFDKVIQKSGRQSKKWAVNYIKALPR